MPLQPPNLDDRNFDELLQEATARIRRTCPDWTDLTPGDPGMALLDVFAFLTEMMIYRLNRIPEKAYIEFLRLIGVKLQPPSASSVNILFSLGRAPDRRVAIPRGTRITLARPVGGTEPPVFVTARAGAIEPGNTEVEILAHHCELVEAELAGKGTGLPGQWVTACRPPIVAPTGEDLDLVVGIEAAPRDLGERERALEHQGKAYRVWREVDSFTNLGPDLYVYIADRMTGTITFAPEVRMLGGDGRLEETPRPLAEFPPSGREIRLWYRRGGGPCKAEANTLTTLKDPIASVLATNPKPATGGRAAETLENALQRGPQDLHSLQRAVTARDFEVVALRSSGAVTRVRALTKSALWKHAPPGTVEVLLVPHLPEDERGGGQVTAKRLHEHETEVARQQIQSALEERRPLGTSCDVNWARYKTVKVQARFVTHPEEDIAAVKTRILDRLHGAINPLPAAAHPGWRFGQALRVSNIYDVALVEPGVSYVDHVRFIVDEVPQKGIHCLVMDAFQPHTWYAGAGSILFRSIDDADGWEPAGRFPGEDVRAVCPHPDRPGLLAVCTNLAGEKSGSRVHISWDCGETWSQAPLETGFQIQDAAWIVRDGEPVLFLATAVGLFEVGMQPEASPIQVFVSSKDSNGFYAVRASRNQAGGISVAVAAQSTNGVFLSNSAGKANTFRNIGLVGEDVRVLAVQQAGPVYFLWAGVMADAGDAGKGCSSWSLLGDADPPEGWQWFSKNWTGGSCQAIAFRGATIVAATHHAGVLRLPARRDDAVWDAPSIGCGLPLREAEHLFYPVETVAGDREGKFILAGGPAGIYRSKDGGASYITCSSNVFTDRVTLPPTWLFCSGEHDIEVVSEDEAERD
ncbi:MAG TPA: baseplate J/gp47 family protein [Terriglobia bacterium]|nr:baseplate J/gp47 family protein [Terriglobia bacterium]